LKICEVILNVISQAFAWYSSKLTRALLPIPCRLDAVSEYNLRYEKKEASYHKKRILKDQSDGTRSELAIFQIQKVRNIDMCCIILELSSTSGAGLKRKPEGKKQATNHM
jgi:hypothetical protein